MKEILNQVYDIEQKSKKRNVDFFERNFRRIYHEIEELGFILKDPLGEKYTLERTDVEATLMNDFYEEMKIVKVLKPIVYEKKNEALTIIQKGVVIVE